MSRILSITISALLLAGCASTTDTYNKSAMPNAASSLQLEAAFCKAKWTAKEFKTYSEWQACQLTAERGFARTIALTKMDAFEAYAADMQRLAADRDARRVTDGQVRSRANDSQRRFLADCGCKPERARLNENGGGGLAGGVIGQDVAAANASFGPTARGSEFNGK